MCYKIVLAFCLLIYAYSTTASVLQAGPNGTLILDGRLWRGIGVNYFDAFTRTLADTADKSYKKGFKTLDSLGIPFVRLSMSGYSSPNMALYVSNKPHYFQLMDSVVASAAANHIGLIPSIIWNIDMPVLMAGQTQAAYADTGSATWVWVKNYYTEIVTRYKNSPAIWAWEIGNEFYPYGDIPNSSVYHTPITTTVLRTFFTGIGNLIHQIDSTRLISSGNQAPWYSQYHRYMYRLDTIANLATYGQDDTRDQCKEVLNVLHPSPINIISSHVYPFQTNFRHYFANSNPRVNEAGYIREINMMSQELGKPLFVGEFGVYDGDVDSNGVALDSAGQTALYTSMVASIETNKVPLAAMWVFDFNYFNPPGQASVTYRPYWTATVQNNRAYQLLLIAAANARIRAKLSTANTLSPHAVQRNSDLIIQRFPRNDLCVKNIPPGAPQVHLYRIDGKEIKGAFGKTKNEQRASFYKTGNGIYFLRVQQPNSVVNYKVSLVK